MGWADGGLAGRPGRRRVHFPHPGPVRSDGAGLRRHAVGPEAAACRLGGAAERRAGSGDPQPHAHQPAQHAEAGPHDGYGSGREIGGGTRKPDRQRHAHALHQERRPRQPVRDRLRRPQAGAGDPGGAVSALDLRRVGPLLQEQRQRAGEALHRGADQGLRAAPQ